MDLGPAEEDEPDLELGLVVVVFVVAVVVGPLPHDSAVVAIVVVSHGDA